MSSDHGWTGWGWGEEVGFTEALPSYSGCLASARRACALPGAHSDQGICGFQGDSSGGKENLGLSLGFKGPGRGAEIRPSPQHC